MVNTKTVDGVHRPVNEDNKYTQEELILMKTQDIGYVLQKLQSERKVVQFTQFICFAFLMFM
jgi:U3 small nucleolar RNA-associated protein 11